MPEDTTEKVQSIDGHASIAEVVRDIADEAARGREATRLADDEESVKTTGLLLVMPHMLAPAPDHEHHLVIYSEKSGPIGKPKEGKTVRRFWARCALCQREDSWAVVDPSWGTQSPAAVAYLKALCFDPAVARIRGLARAEAAEEGAD